MGGYPLIRPLLFTLAPETAHGVVQGCVRTAAALPGFGALTAGLYGYDHPALRVRVWGEELPNPVGLAAGFDKDGMMLGPLARLGFGLVEAGTVTPRPQPGNPRPRLFRLPDDGALVNRMGFNNQGAEALAGRLARLSAQGGVLPGGCRVGVNIGKNQDTPLAGAVEDYVLALRAVYRNCAYLTVNVSSPNTPGLRSLQGKAELAALLGALAEERTRCIAAGLPRLPLLVKLAPDMSEGALTDAVEVVLGAGCDGIIATNTTLAREGLRSPAAEETGGLSGRPLHARSVAAVAALHRITGGKLPLVGVGGVFSAADAYDFIRAGAILVQVYTGLIYQGPGLVRGIKRGLVRLLERDGYSRLEQAVGTANSGGGLR